MALNVTSPFEFKQRVLAVKTFLGRAENASITQAQKRIVNLLKKSDPSTLQTLSPTDLTLAVERSLWECVESLKPKVAQLVAQQEYTQAILLTAQLSAPIDAFFEGVMVMDEDLSVRARRLSLLQRVRELFLSVADLSALPG
jgi:glycyl-tRNA synthetase beta chain